jgi:hypothetical protein
MSRAGEEEQRAQRLPTDSPRNTFANANFWIRLGSVFPETIFSTILFESAVLTSSVRAGPPALHPYPRSEANANL